MNKDLQNKAWASLPAEFRKEVREMYAQTENDPDYEQTAITLHDLFGHENLKSDIEPEEMLMVERKKVQEKYKRSEKLLKEDTNRKIEEWERYFYKGRYQGWCAALNTLFGDKCLPDKRQPESKYSKGDKVRIVKGDLSGKIGTVVFALDDMTKVLIEHGDDEPFLEKYEYYNLWGDGWLEPYTEENKEPIVPKDDTKDDTKETMEEKELNLCGLLKDCEDMELYSAVHGKCKLFKIYTNNNNRSQPLISVTLENDAHCNYASTGKINWSVDKFAPIILYPSRALYEKYPLDAYSAWTEWKEARKPKRWHPKDEEGFWCISPMLKPHYNAESDPEFDWESDLNHFETEDICLKACEIVGETLMRFHEKSYG